MNLTEEQEDEEFRKEHDLYIQIISSPVNGWGGHSDPRNPKWDIFHYLGYLRRKYGKERSDAYVDTFYAAKKKG